MKYLKFYYSYPLSPGIVNLGDYVQTIAVENALSKIGVDIDKDTVSFNRDALSYYNDNNVTCVMQGWFSSTYDWLPSKKINPVYVGTHFIERIDHFLNEETTKLELNRSGAVGCRDLYTCNKLKNIGVDAYFSRCLTLTFDKRDKEPKNPKIHIVNVPEHISEFINFDDDREVVTVNQRGIGAKECYSLYSEKYYNMAKDLMQEYKENAGLVITSAIHCAMPCIAMGIPVVIINPNVKVSDFAYRYSVISDLIKIYNVDDLRNGLVDLNPKTIDIEPLKELIIKNLKNSIDIANGKELTKEMTEVRNKIAEFKVSNSDGEKKSMSSKNKACKKTKNTWLEEYEYTDVMFERIKKLFNMIKDVPNVSSVMDLGCGKQQAKPHVPSHMEYIPVDYLKHVDSTIQKDFNKGEFYHRKVSLCLCSGVLEYIKNLDKFVKNMSKNCDYVLGSYSFTETNPVRHRIWVNNYTFEKFVNVFYKNGFLLEKYERGLDKNDRIFDSNNFRDSAEYYFLFRKRDDYKKNLLAKKIRSIKKFLVKIPVIGQILLKIKRTLVK